jgi:hypothetical protein
MKGLVWCWVARAFSQLKRGGLDAARDSAARLEIIVGDLQGNRFWSNIVNWWISDGDAQPGGHSTGWLDGGQAARARWLAVRPQPARADPGQP